MSFVRPVPAPAPQGSDTEILEDMLEVLRLAASIRAPERAMAVRYTEARARMVSGRLKSFVPPFLTQCVSIFKFQDFIRLYAPDAAQRIQFIEQSFEPCRRATGFTRRYDVFGEDA